MSKPDGFGFEQPDEQWLARIRSALHAPESRPDGDEASPSGQGRYAAGMRLGPYELVRRIGMGGMGTVWLARRADGLFQRDVAIKLIKRGMDTETVVRRFHNERHVLATLVHPHIARLYDGGATPDGQPFLVMEYVEGLPIVDYCESQGLSIEKRLHLFRQVCLAVHHAHRHLILHRDVKPANILVAADGNPKLLDFGIAKLLDPESGEASALTATDVRPLTPRYASPEQLRGERLTTATDVYSLGVVLHELLTGRRLYAPDSSSLRLVEHAVLTEEPPRPSLVVRRRDDLPTAQSRCLQRLLRGDLDTIVMTALQKDPSKRYPSAEQLAEDLGRYRAGLPLLARPPGPVARMVGLIRRRRAPLVAAATGALLSLALASAFIVYQFLMPAWAQAHLRNARLSVVGPRTNHAMYNIIFFNAPDRRDAKRPRMSAGGLDTVLAEYKAALRLAPRDVVVRLEHDIVLLAHSWDRDPDQFFRITNARRNKLPLTCAYAEHLRAHQERLAFTPARLEQASATDLRALGFMSLLRGDPETTIDAWTRFELGATDPLIDASLGNIYLALDLPELAYPRLLSAHRAYPQAGNVTAYLADAAARAGDWIQARRLIEIAAQQEGVTDNSRPLMRLQMLCLLSENKEAEALELYRDTELYGCNPVATVQLAEYFERRGQEVKALHVLGDRLKLDRNAGYATAVKFQRLMEFWWSRLTTEERNRNVELLAQSKWGNSSEFAALLATYMDSVQWLKGFPDPHTVTERAGWWRLVHPTTPESLRAARVELRGLADSLTVSATPHGEP